MKTMKTPFFRYAPVKMMNLEKANHEAALLFCRKTKNTWVFRKGLGLYVCNSQTAHYLGGALGIIVAGCQGVRVCSVLSDFRVWRSSKGSTAVNRLQTWSMYGRARV